MKYRIELTEEQMRVLEDCCNQYMRILMGQTSDLANLLTEHLCDAEKLAFERYITKRNAIYEILNSAFLSTVSEYQEVEEATNLAIKALEKQIPKKIRFITMKVIPKRCLRICAPALYVTVTCMVAEINIVLVVVKKYYGGINYEIIG